MIKALAFFLLLLQLTSFSAFAEDPVDALNDIFGLLDPFNAFSKESETLHKPSHAHSLHHESLAPSPHHHLHSPSHSHIPHHQSPAPSRHHHHHSPSPAPSRHHQSPPPSSHHKPHAPSPHQHSPSPAPSPHHQSLAPSPHHHHHSPSPSPSPHHHNRSPSPSSSPRHQSPAPSPHHQSPAPSPRHQSTIVPAKSPNHHNPPTHSPSPLSPTPVPRSVMVIRGVVYVKSCKYSGLDTLKEAKPLLGAVVKLQCNNTKYKLDETDKDGHFSLVGPKIITIYTAKQCNVVLVSAPHGLKPSKLHDGISGAILRPKRRFVSKGVPFILFATQPLAFEPNCPR
ncbi:hypothetical protein MtrunA17_Chr4g0033381 [Medicago truncatula]|uniref:Pollen Ole e I family allergen n=1 Tax=Medicago truncatula TaxID=3880 RepID=A0A072UWS5_MEDTR|nr:non-classical arabinogalactan protein 30 [Medicago truncatula]KEH30305.1 pollen Ole e I family allergen [Medicago truncatula]RHN61137.1 hypothetical protein MtrunA17_Chr4g0033381 [Medicago truncatula]